MTITVRQREILTAVSQGHTSREIAAALGISIRTVEKHRANLGLKLRVHNAVQMVQRASEARLL